MTTYKLSFATSTLLLEIDSNNWCRCTLEEGTSFRYSGADAFCAIVSRLSDSVQNNAANKYEWVLSLNEYHHSLYVRQVKLGTEYAWQDKQANWISKIVLAEHQLEELTRQLKQLSSLQS